jgi:hypothetical protein
MDIAHPMDTAGIEQDAFGERSFSGIDVGHDANVS